MKTSRVPAQQYLASFFGLHTIPLMVVSVLTAGITALLEELLQMTIDHSVQILAINIIIVADFITGLLVAHQQKKIETHKAKKIIFDIVGYNFAVFMCYLMAKAYPVLSFVPDMVAIPIIVINAFSTLKNISLLCGKNTVFLQIFYNIDRYKNEYIKGSGIDNLTTDPNKKHEEKTP